MFKAPLFRATVVYANSTTGEIQVRIPVLSGTESTVPISYIGRTAYNGVWSVPEIGKQIVVSADDANLTNVFWVQVNPDAPTSLSGLQSQINGLDTRLTNVEATVAQHTSDIATTNTAVNELRSYKDAIIFGIFN
jgi:hypothetical protein